MQVELFCDIQLGVMDQMVYAINEDGTKNLLAKVPLNHLAKMMPHYCFERGATTIHLFGHPVIIEELKTKIIEEEGKQYNRTNIVIKVNE